ncbi:aspartic peptidase domain-containing protein [Microdochium trichocladiopsis]|uniref:Aspartic peptidase domain-containing protein n=1 Tax=Microdochium trichocladiopsis TaxID=1682393 RepID=A0A9P9BR14_9PEZI|nr:aspartic peptidase domain-containing protein [Microdochium trichocladiopsis]KAH7031503.1 aspartic peptidase domain-containing protein [Microdochium trichocladiopsis]
MATRSIFALAAAVAAVQAASDVPTVAIPLVLRYAQGKRVATDIVLPYATIEAVYDLGSPDFIMFEDNSTMNWGCQYLGCQGKCNASVPDTISYNPDLSTTKTDEAPWNGVYGYGGGLTKMYTSDKTINDTFTFSNAVGPTLEVPNVKVALVQYLQQRIYDANGTCSPVPTYSQSILGISPHVENSVTGPSFRQNLLDSGAISAAVQSLWFDKPPSDNITSGEPWIGTGLLGGIDTSKYTGPLVRIQRSFLEYSQDQYYTSAANMTFFGGGGVPGVALPNNYSIELTGVNMTECLIDSGAGSESFFPADEAAWLTATGLRWNPDRTQPGSDLAFPGPCDTIPEDSYFEYSFVGAREGESVTVKIPLRNYHRYQDPLDEQRGWCTVAIYLRGCGLSRTFNTAVYFAADDERFEIAIAQGGISEVGSGVDQDSVVLRIP